MAGKATLFITPKEGQPGHYLVVVDGEGFHDKNGKEVGARIRGDDKWFDDTLFSLGPSRVLGGIFNLSTTVAANSLNEDWGEDEIYASVKIAGSSEIRTNTIRRSF